MGRPKLKFDDLWVPVTESGCWLWVGSMAADGYGEYSAGRTDSKSRPPKAHRYSYVRAHGAIPDGQCVCHRCDVPLCVNPRHLFLGSPLVNNSDKVRKARHIYGRRVRTAKLTEDQVREIRSASGTIASIAQRYGITDANVSQIRLGRTWKQVNAA